MLSKVDLIKKLQNNISFEKNDFKRLDNIYYLTAVDLKAIINCPIYKAHTNEMFQMLATYYLHRLHNLRVLLHKCAESKCIDYKVIPVWKPRSILKNNAWEKIKGMISFIQDPANRHLQGDAETRMALRQMASDIQILMREFKVICVNYYNKIPDNLNSIIRVETVEECGPHSQNCQNFFCDYNRH